MTTQAKAPNELGTANIGKLLISYALPAIAAQMTASIYNIVDSIFIGHGVNNPLALSGLGLTLPLMNLAAAFGALVGAGGAALLSIKLGQKDKESANRVLGNVLVLNIIIGLTVMTFGLVFIDPILYLFGASEQTLPFAKSFMKVILFGNTITHLYMGFSCLMRSCGYPKKSMYITLLSVVMNLILAPIFIFVFQWGIAGAAWATIISQTISLIVLLFHFTDKTKYLYLQRRYFRLKSDIVKNIISVGMSPFMQNICSCLVVIVINNLLKSYGGDYAIGAYSNVNKILMMFAMLVIGLNQGMQPIAGYNFGAKQYDRVIQVLKKAIFYATCTMCFACLVCELFPEAVCRIFTDNEEMNNIATTAMRIIIMTFPIVGFQMVTSNFFQSIGKAIVAAILSTTRQLLFLLPALLILPNFFGLNGVWFSMPVSDAISTILAAFFLRREIKKLKYYNNNKQ
jgi:putative MATE family efflux protein